VHFYQWADLPSLRQRSDDALGRVAGSGAHMTMSEGWLVFLIGLALIGAAQFFRGA
jgi:hypothetical protein